MQLLGRQRVGQEVVCQQILQGRLADEEEAPPDEPGVGSAPGAGATALAIVQAPAGHAVKYGHDEKSYFWLAGWSAACESPSPGHSEPHLERIVSNITSVLGGQLPSCSHAS